MSVPRPPMELSPRALHRIASIHRSKELFKKSQQEVEAVKQQQQQQRGWRQDSVGAAGQLHADSADSAEFAGDGAVQPDLEVLMLSDPIGGDTVQPEVLRLPDIAGEETWYPAAAPAATAGGSTAQSSAAPHPPPVAAVRQASASSPERVGELPASTKAKRQTRQSDGSLIAEGSAPGTPKSGAKRSPRVSLDGTGSRASLRTSPPTGSPKAASPARRRASAEVSNGEVQALQPRPPVGALAPGQPKWPRRASVEVSRPAGAQPGVKVRTGPPPTLPPLRPRQPDATAAPGQQANLSRDLREPETPKSTTLQAVEHAPIASATPSPQPVLPESRAAAPAQLQLSSSTDSGSDDDSEPERPERFSEVEDHETPLPVVLDPMPQAAGAPTAPATLAALAPEAVVSAATPEAVTPTPAARAPETAAPVIPVVATVAPAIPAPTTVSMPAVLAPAAAPAPTTAASAATVPAPAIPEHSTSAPATPSQATPPSPVATLPEPPVPQQSPPVGAPASEQRRRSRRVSADLTAPDTPSTPSPAESPRRSSKRQSSAGAPMSPNPSEGAAASPTSSPASRGFRIAAVVQQARAARMVELANAVPSERDDGAAGGGSSTNKKKNNDDDEDDRDVDEETRTMGNKFRRLFMAVENWTDWSGLTSSSRNGEGSRPRPSADRRERKERPSSGARPHVSDPSPQPATLQLPATTPSPGRGTLLSATRKSQEVHEAAGAQEPASPPAGARRRHHIHHHRSGRRDDPNHVVPEGHAAVGQQTGPASRRMTDPGFGKDKEEVWRLIQKEARRRAQAARSAAPEGDGAGGEAAATEGANPASDEDAEAARLAQEEEEEESAQADALRRKLAALSAARSNDQGGALGALVSGIRVSQAENSGKDDPDDADADADDEGEGRRANRRDRKAGVASTSAAAAAAGSSTEEAGEGGSRSLKPPEAELAATEGGYDSCSEAAPDERDTVLMGLVFDTWFAWAHDRSARRHANQLNRARIRLYKGTAIHRKLRTWYRRACFRGIERGQGLPLNADFKKTLHRILADQATQLPHTCRLLVRRAAIPVVEAMAKVYTAQLGSKSRITHQVMDHLDALRQEDDDMFG